MLDIDELLKDLQRLLPAQFEMVLERARVPREYLSAPGAPQAARAIELMQWAREDDRLLSAVVDAVRRVRQLPDSEVDGLGKPRISNLPARNTNFAGRRNLLARIRRQLSSTRSNRPVALYGMGGVGKTQAVTEYAHRYANEYDIIWRITADQPKIIAEQIASLAGPVGVSFEDPLPEVAAAIVDLLRNRPRWLLIFDAAQQPADLLPYLVGGNGHILITSQQRGWGAIADQIEVDVFDRRDSVRLLRGRLGLNETLAADIAEELGDLPLALEQVAAHLDATGIPADEYLQLFRARSDVLPDGEALGYDHTVSTAWALQLGRMEAESHAAVRLLEILSYFPSDSVPLEIFTSHSSLLPEPLTSAAKDPFDFSRTIGTIVRYSLGRRQLDGLEVHRLLRTAIRKQLGVGRAKEVSAIARTLIFHSCPEGHGPETWARWAQLTPHLLASPSIARSDVDGSARRVLLSAGRYLYIRGDYRAARDFSSELRDRWHPVLGHDHPDVLTAGKNLASALVGLGKYVLAASLHREVYERRVEVLGSHNLSALSSGTDLADTLRLAGEFEQAFKLNSSTYSKFLNTFGARHPDTLRCANNLANDLYGLKRIEEARKLDEETLDLRAAVLGERHPDTIASATNFGTDLYAAGSWEEARAVLENAYDKFLDVVGGNHPDVLIAANNLALAVSRCGRPEIARKLLQDTVKRLRRVLGDIHPLTISTAVNLDTSSGEMIRI